MTSTLILYKDCKVLPERIFKVDQFATYLATLTKTTISEFQYIKHSLSLTIKIPSSQPNLEYVQDNNFNYCSIKNNQGTTSISTKLIYYFIVGKKWTAEGTIELTLSMDTINTFYDDLDISDRTKILREHKGRWNFLENDYLSPKIDRYPEGITPILYKTVSSKLMERIGSTRNDTMSYYLAFRNSDATGVDPDNPPVDRILIPEKKIRLADTGTYYSGTKTHRTIYENVTEQTSGHYYLLILADENPDLTITYTKDGSTHTLTIPSHSMVQIVLGGIDILYYQNGHWYTQEQNRTTDNDTVTFQQLSIARNGDDDWDDYDAAGIISNYAEQTVGFAKNVSGYIDGFSSLDRTDPKLIRVIKCPYCPVEISYSGGRYIIDTSMFSTINVKGHTYLKINDNISSFENTMHFDGEYVDPFEVLSPVDGGRFFNQKIAKSTRFEPKLYHSDFYKPKFVYDSFGFIFQLEKLPTQPSSFDVIFKTTTTMTSNFLFAFPTYNILGQAESDYEMIMPVARNNEVPLFNSAYLNYLRVGFNYDVKTKNRQATASIVSTAGQAVIGIASFVAAAVAPKAFAPALIAAGISLSLSTGVSVINTVNSINQSEQNIQAKLAQNENQAISVAGSDDVDLMSYYTDSNKAKLVFYEVSPRMKKALFDLFYYTGYIANYMGKPSPNSRKSFNFISAEVVFEKVPNLPSDIIEDIRTKFGYGITFLHRWNNEWDFEQQYENWEVNTKIIDEVVTASNFSINKEYVINPNIVATDVGRLTRSGALTLRRRSRSSLEVISTLTITGLDTFTINGLATQKVIDVRIGSNVQEKISFDDYANADVYWTIEYGQLPNDYYNREIVYSNILGYISEE